jgi:hypothetical protein
MITESFKQYLLLNLAAFKVLLISWLSIEWILLVNLDQYSKQRPSWISKDTPHGIL